MNKLDKNTIRQFLEKKELYQSEEFSLPTDARSDLCIKEIDGFCKKCGKIKPFQDTTHRPVVVGLRSNSIQISELESDLKTYAYTCVSCNSEKHIFCIEQTVSDDKIELKKFGQHPRKQLVRDKQLQKFLKTDIDNYEKGEICLHHCYGVAAFSYFRRIVENNIDELLSNIENELVSTNSLSTEISNAIKELHGKKPMTEKIKIANKALPDFLLANGVNPLGRLYKVLSEGIHKSSDKECLEKAEKLKACLSFLISELSHRREQRERFSKNIGSL